MQGIPVGRSCFWNTVLQPPTHRLAAGGIPFDCHVRVGRTAPNHCPLCRGTGIRAVMDTRGRPGFTYPPPGSAPQYVMRHPGIPVAPVDQVLWKNAPCGRD